VQATTILCLVLGARVAAASPAAPSLADFLSAARNGSLEVQQQRANVDERQAAERVESANLLPKLAATGDYLRNQYEVVEIIPHGTGAPAPVTFTPKNQFDATFELDIPLLDLGARKRKAAAGYDIAAARATLAVDSDEVARSVVRAYYQWVGGMAQLASAQAARTAAVDNLQILAQRRTAGLAGDLDVSRAQSQISRTEQSMADAQLTIASARRTLRTYTGRDAIGDAPKLPSDTSAEASLARWLSGASAAPEVASAVAAEHAAEERASADRWSYMPTINALARERITNAVGYSQEANWALGFNVSW
jgi:outer membrane protein TolC